jgi:hypothetical protein
MRSWSKPNHGLRFIPGDTRSRHASSSLPKNALVRKLLEMKADYLINQARAREHVRTLSSLRPGTRHRGQPSPGRKRVPLSQNASSGSSLFPEKIPRYEYLSAAREARALLKVYDPPGPCRIKKRIRRVHNTEENLRFTRTNPQPPRPTPRRQKAATINVPQGYP